MTFNVEKILMKKLLFIFLSILCTLLVTSCYGNSGLMKRVATVRWDDPGNVSHPLLRTDGYYLGSNDGLRYFFGDKNTYGSRGSGLYTINQDTILFNTYHSYYWPKQWDMYSGKLFILNDSTLLTDSILINRPSLYKDREYDIYTGSVDTLHFFKSDYTINRLKEISLRSEKWLWNDVKNWKEWKEAGAIENFEDWRDLWREDTNVSSASTDKIMMEPLKWGDSIYLKNMPLRIDGGYRPNISREKPLFLCKDGTMINSDHDHLKKGNGGVYQVTNDSLIVDDYYYYGIKSNNWERYITRYVFKIINPKTLRLMNKYEFTPKDRIPKKYVPTVTIMYHFFPTGPNDSSVLELRKEPCMWKNGTN